MLLLDDILLAPIKLPIAGFNWILRQVQTRQFMPSAARHLRWSSDALS